MDLSTADSLPRLCYVGNVPVEPTMHGSALLWRLLEPYPRERLLIVECERPSHVAGRLSGVPYARADMYGSRLLFSRVAPIATPLLFRFSRLLAGRIEAEVRRFKPEAILSVANGICWKVAYEISARMNLPFHLIIHDAVLPPIPGNGRLREHIENTFARVYEGAASRLCVSPYMAADFLARYGVAGTVLYPSRARQAVVFDAPQRREGWATRGLTGAFAGTIFPSYAIGLAQVANALKERGGRLLIFGPTDLDVARRMGLGQDNVEFRGLVDSEELKVRCRQDADFLFVPMSFLESERLNMEVSFPSKLADYTAIGCPLLIRGPRYCSAVRWARENPGVAQIVDTEDGRDLDQAVASLENPDVRWNLATQALRLGEVYFSSQRATQTLNEALLSSSARAATTGSPR